MFYGTYDHTVDEKSRCAVPARFRDAVSTPEGGREWYLARGSARCIEGYTKDRWDRLTAVLGGSALPGTTRGAYNRLVFASAAYAVCDAQGRIQIPDKLKQYAGIERNVVFVGVNDHYEIWDAVRWSDYEAEHESRFEALADEVSRALSAEEKKQTDGR